MHDFLESATSMKACCMGWVIREEIAVGTDAHLSFTCTRPLQAGRFFIGMT